MEKSVKGYKYLLSFFYFPTQYLRLSGNLAHSGNFSSFNSAIVLFSKSSTSLDLGKLYNCIVSFQLRRLKCEA